MQITRFEDAKRYDAPKHFDMRSLRLQGFEASDSWFAWVGISHFLPQGGAEMDAGPLEKIYVVLAGKVTIVLGDGSLHVLGALDSCHIPGGEARAVRNDGNSVATMLVVMPHPKEGRP
jgi:mannose-6-phosphate isomerase-like protein (cupin superfamily)